MNHDHQHLVDEIYCLIDSLHDTSCMIMKDAMLDELKDKVSALVSLEASISRICVKENEQREQNPYPARLTLEQLAAFNGKNGNPAYVALDGLIYDVTNNAAWAAATHFGLHAGKDVTEQFHECHKGKGIFDKLIRIGSLV